jgi:hypothetical protein
MQQILRPVWRKDITGSLGNKMPPVSIASAGGQVVILYPLSGSNRVLQTATNMVGPWVPVTNGVPQNAFSFSNGAPAVFFRLQ